MGMKPQRWLKDGDVVEVSLEGVGTCTNKVEFNKAKSKLQSNAYVSQSNLFCDAAIMLILMRDRLS